MLITLYKIGGVQFRLLGTNGFHVKAKNERFTAAGLRCRQNLKYENFTSSFGTLRQNIASKSVPHVQHDYFSSFNQSNHWFVAFVLTSPLLNLKLPSSKDGYGSGNGTWNVNICAMAGTMLRLLFLVCTLYCWQSTPQTYWWECWWSKYSEWKIYCCVFTLSLKPEILRRCLVNYLTEFSWRKKYLPHVEHVCFSSFNQLYSLVSGIRELQQTRLRRKREHHLKMWLRVSAIIF